MNLVKYYGKTHHKELWLELDNRIDFAQEQKPKFDLQLPREFRSLSSPNILNREPLRYLKQDRGLTNKDILSYKLGYCTSGEYEDFIIVPSFNKYGSLNFFVGRAYRGWRTYKNPPINRMELIFNELNVDWRDDLVLVEGVFDSFKAYNSIPLLGSSINERSELFGRLIDSDQKIYVALDPDAEKKEVKVINTLLEYDAQVYKIPVAPYKDVGEMTKQEFQKRKQQAIPIDRRIRRLAV